MYEQALKADHKGKIYHYDPSSNCGTGSTIRDPEGTGTTVTQNGRSKQYSYVFDNYFTGPDGLLRSYFNMVGQPGTVAGGHSGENQSPHDYLAGKTSGNAGAIIIDGGWYPRICQPSIFLYNKDVVGPGGGVIHHYENELSTVVELLSSGNWLWGGQINRGRTQYEYIARDMELLMAKYGIADQYLSEGYDVEIVKDHLNVAMQISNGQTYFFPYFQDAAHITRHNAMFNGASGTTLRSLTARDYATMHTNKTGAALAALFNRNYNGKFLVANATAWQMEIFDGLAFVPGQVIRGTALIKESTNDKVNNFAVSEAGVITWNSNVTVTQSFGFYVRIDGTFSSALPIATGGAVTFTIPSVVAGTVYNIEIWRQPVTGDAATAANTHRIFVTSWTAPVG